MPKYTIHHAIPYPEGEDRVAVHSDLELLAIKTDVELNTARRVADSALKGAVPQTVRNLFDHEDTVSGSLSSSGNVSEHSVNRVSGFIPVRPGESYVSWAENSIRVVFFDFDRNALSGTDTGYLAGGQVWDHVAPTNGMFVRIGVYPTQSLPTPQIIFNRGTEIWSPDGDVASGWWDDRELPPNQPIRFGDLDAVTDDRLHSKYVDGAVPERITNLLDPSTVVPGTLSGSGNIIAHNVNVTSAPIPVDPGQPYVSYNPPSHRIVFFTANNVAITTTDTALQPAGTTAHWVAPPNAAYVRFGINIAGTSTPDDAIFNRGTVLWSPDDNVQSGWWDDRELPPGQGGSAAVDEDELIELVESLLPQWEPSLPTLQFEDVTDGWADPAWLSSDGEILFGRQGLGLLQSTDEWETTDMIYGFEGYSIHAVHQLDNGELLVSTGRDESQGLKAKLWLSEGYDPATASVTGFTEVLEAGAPQANINASWGLHSYQNVVIAGEYGLRGENGARRVWMSEDYAYTWKLVFDQKTVDAPGGPEWTENAHVHTAAWDPYWSRLWVACGDSPSTATYYSDDKGETWVYVEGTGGPSPAVQYTGIMPLPDMVIFGSDRAPNGVHGYRRTSKADMPKIRPLHLVNDRDVITHVFQLAFKRDWHPTTPTYFAASSVTDQDPTVIVGSVDGKKWHTLWEGELPGSGLPKSGRVMRALGPTAQGNIIAVMESDPTVTGRLTMKAPAPTWARL